MLPAKHGFVPRTVERAKDSCLIRLTQKILTRIWTAGLWDQNIIVSILKSGNFDKIEWDEDDDSADIEAAQNVRGYHTLEYLLFKDGKPRKVNN